MWHGVLDALREMGAGYVSLWRTLPDVSAAIGAPESARRIARTQFRTLLCNAQPSLSTICVGMVLQAGALGFMLPERRWAVLAWFVCMLGLVGYMQWLQCAFAHAAVPDEALRGWEVRVGVSCVLLGGLWGGSLFLLPAGSGSMPFIAIGSLLVVAGGLSLYNVYRPAIAWLVPPCAVLTSAALVLQGSLLDKSLGLAYVFTVALLMRMALLHNDLMTQTLLQAEQRARLLTELDVQRAAAEAASQAKTRFLAAVSHDLRQPMHSISLLTVALRQHLREDPAGLCGQISASAQAMDELIEALLEVSRLDDGTLPVQVASVPLGPLLERVGQLFAAQAEAQGLAFQVQADTAACVRSDVHQLQRVLANLVSNAIRYTPRGGVRVRCRVRAGVAWLQVWDSGLGISREDRQRIFDELVRLNGPRHPGPPGVGLGLSIVRKVAHRLGHPVVLRSQPQRGSMFAIGVPLDHAPSLPLVGGSSELLSGQLVLLIDDDALVLQSTQALLASFGARVMAAQSVAQALQAVEASLRTPDLILSDFELPGSETGVDAILRVRGLVEGPLPALLVTARAAVAKAAATPLGIGVLSKPLRVEALEAALESLLADAKPRWKPSERPPAGGGRG